MGGRLRTRRTRVAIALTCLAAVLGSVGPAAAEYRTAHLSPAPVLRGSIGPAVVAGTPVAQGAQPWSAFLGIFESGVPTGQCSGTLIGAEWLLTAAHCVTDATGGFPVGLQVGVLVDATDATVATQGEVAGAADAFVPASYNPVTSQNDVALIRLDRAVAARPLPFARSDQAGLAAGGVTGTLTGWGTVDQAGAVPSDLLRTAQVPIVADAACAAEYPNAGGRFFTAAVNLCAAPTALPSPTGSACLGDSGGTLAVPDAAGPVLAGIVSWGVVPCGTGSTVFTRVSAMAPGIVATMKADATSPVAAPTATLPAVAGVTTTSASISASVSPNRLATRWVLDYGPTTAYGLRVRGEAGGGSVAVPVAVQLTGLTPGTTYHARLTAESAAGVSAAADVAFTTVAAPPPPIPPPPATAPIVTTRAAVPRVTARCATARRTVATATRRLAAARRALRAKRTPAARARVLAATRFRTAAIRSATRACR